MAARPWSDDDEATLRRLHGEQLSAREIAKQMDRPPSTISRHAAISGLSFDRTITHAATQAATVDAKARRTALGLAMLTDLEEARLRLGASGSAREFQAAAQGMDALVRSYVNLQKLEVDDHGLAAAVSMVDMLMGRLTDSVREDAMLNPSVPLLELAQ